MRNIQKDNKTIFAENLLDRFIGRITGKDVNRLTVRNPEDSFFVGKLSPEGSENKFLNSSTFVSQIGLEFIIPKKDLKYATINVEIKGDFFYRVFPNLEEQRDYLISTAKKTYPELGKCSLDEIKDYLQKEAEAFSCGVAEVFEKVPLKDYYFEICLQKIYNPEKKFGFTSLRDSINAKLDKKIDEVYSNKNNYRITKEKVKFNDIKKQEKWDEFFKTKGQDKIRQSWDLDLECEIKPYGEDAYKVSLLLKNKTQDGQSGIPTINTLFNSGLGVKIKNADFGTILLDYFKDDYKYDKEQKAIGVNCSVEIVAPQELRTSNLPIFKQYRLKTNAIKEASFDNLSEKPIEVLELINKKMGQEVVAWKEFEKEKIKEFEKNRNENGKEKLKKEIKEFETEKRRFENGIRVLKQYDDLREAFVLMNKAFKASSKSYDSWFLFQIVFIVSLIPDIGTSEYPEEEMGPNCFIDKVDLLFYPTGGGKTEAFLGIVIFTLFFDRIRGKDKGVSAIIKYPLRLLSVQQVERAAQILASAELIRREETDLKNSAPFSLGYYVGDQNSPNKITKELQEKIKDNDEDFLNEKFQIIETCPFCLSQKVQVNYEEETNRLKHVCKSSNCPSDGDINVLIVDREIYRYLPSVIISTLDKFSAIGFQSDFRNIMGEVLKECPTHGFTSKNKCTERDRGLVCEISPEKLKKVEIKDPAPTILIQDELHLVRESLGVYDGHYETLFYKYIKLWGSSKKKMKILGATATISSYEEQIFHLYMKEAVRFPSESPFIDKNFYSYLDKEDLQRYIIGYAPFGKAIINNVVYSLKYMKEILWEYFINPSRVKEIDKIKINSLDEAKDILKDYWVILQYNNVKLDGNRVLNALSDPINTELESANIQPFEERKMTGDDSFQDIRKILAELEGSKDIFEGFNIIVATSMISHGVDANRFNLMYFFGMPNNTAEYIQAYSRIGRAFTGISIMIFRPTRERDQSYLRNFNRFHECKDILVEPVPINRWANKAIEKTLPGILSGLILNYYDLFLQNEDGNIYMMKGLQDAITKGAIKKEELKMMIIEAYCCKDTTLGRQYEKIIDTFVDRFFEKIPFENFEQDNNIYITEGLAKMGFNSPMFSLRDTDTPVKIELG